MADVADKSSDEYEEHCQYSIGLALRNAAKIQAGQPGECELCDVYFSRIVQVNYKSRTLYACADCRDGLKLG